MTVETVTARFARALAKMTNPPETARSHHGQYVPLNALLDHVRPVLATEGLAVSQHATEAGIRTVLVSVDGETLDLGCYPVDWSSNSQQTGSAVTYARRYGLAAAFGVFGEHDDDGQVASATRRKPAGPSNLSAGQLKRLQATWSAVERETRLSVWSDLTGRPIRSANELTKAEAAKIIDQGAPNV